MNYSEAGPDQSHCAQAGTGDGGKVTWLLLGWEGIILVALETNHKHSLQPPGPRLRLALPGAQQGWVWAVLSRDPQENVSSSGGGV